MSSWNGSDRDASRFDLVLDAAHATPGFVAAPLLELPAEKDDGVVDVAALQRSLFRVLERADNAAFLHIGDRPVVFVLEYK